MPASPSVRKAILRRYRQSHKPQLAAYMREYRAKDKAPSPQSVDLSRCEALDDRRVDRVIAARWMAGQQREFDYGIEEVA